MTIAQIIAAIEDLAPDVKCAAIVTFLRRNTVAICMSPDDEDARWAGDLRLRAYHGQIYMTLEHSGPVGQWVFANNAAGLRDLLGTLRRELAE